MIVITLWMIMMILQTRLLCPEWKCNRDDDYDDFLDEYDDFVDFLMMIKKKYNCNNDYDDSVDRVALPWVKNNRNDDYDDFAEAFLATQTHKYTMTQIHKYKYSNLQMLTWLCWPGSWG